MLEATGQFATFVVGGLYFGVDVLSVQEVLQEQEMTRVPLAPAVVEGLINLRGQIVTAIDVRRRLGLPERPAEQTPMSMVIRTQDTPVSLLVDEIGEVVSIDPSCYERAPGHIHPDIRDLTHGVYKLEDRLLLVLDTERVANLSNAEAA